MSRAVLMGEEEYAGLQKLAAALMDEARSRIDTHPFYANVPTEDKRVDCASRMAFQALSIAVISHGTARGLDPGLIVFALITGMGRVLGNAVEANGADNKQVLDHLFREMEIGRADIRKITTPMGSA